MASSQPNLFDAAINAAKGGRLGEAEELLHRLLTASPRHGEGVRLLGKIRLQCRDAQAALVWLEKAAAMLPNDPEIDYEIGVALLALERWSDATERFSTHLRLRPHSLPGLFNLAWSLRRAGRLDEAISLWRKLVGLAPDQRDAWFNLGNCLFDADCLDEAAEAFQACLSVDATYSQALNNLGMAQMRLGRGDDAERNVRAAIAQNMRLAVAHRALAAILDGRGQYAGAVESYRQALAIEPGSEETLCGLAESLSRLGQVDTAASMIDTALTHQPGSVPLLLARGRLCLAKREIVAARVCFEQAAKAAPEDVVAWGNLGKALSMLGRENEALVAFERAHHLAPQRADAHSNYLFALLHADLPPEEVFNAHTEFGRLHERAPELKASRASDDPNKKLRVGYVSPDLCRHSVAFFLEGILTHHDPAYCEIVCYHTSRREDEVTERFRAMVAGWRNVAGLAPAVAAGLIRDDGIDILVDLAGHSAENGLEIFALKAAPIQATWLGYPGTTGLSRVDYRLGSFPAEALAATARLSTETPLHLLTDAAFMPPAEAPDVEPPPFLANGHITFGSLNKPMKVTDDVRQAWAAILTRVPGSRLLIVVADGDLPEVAQGVRRQFAALGVCEDRIEPVGFRPLADFLALHHHVDIALDPFPYGGGTTTLLSLWMGVPVVRIGRTDPAGLLNDANFWGETVESYVEAAVHAALDTDRLLRLRAELRGRMAAMLEGVARDAARRLEATFRVMWWTHLEAGRHDG